MKRGKTNAKRKPLAVAVEPVVRRKNALYRAGLSCAIGRDAIEGRIEIPANVSPMEWAMFNLLHAVEEIASAIEPNPVVRGATKSRTSPPRCSTEG